MKSAPGQSRDTTPPSFEDAANLRQRACAAGMDPAYWYPVEWDKNLAAGKVQEVKFWGTSVALYRAEDGKVHAVENRCAHRQVKLSHGWVENCRIKCVYHGWTYGPDGKLDLVIGAAGGATIPVQVAKALIGWIDWGLSAQQAIALPVLYSPGDTVIVEQGTPLEAMIPQLKALGHANVVARSLPIKGNAIERGPNGWIGAADPRSDGVALSQ